jgi:hypothetical protein
MDMCSSDIIEEGCSLYSPSPSLPLSLSPSLPLSLVSTRVSLPLSLSL